MPKSNPTLLIPTILSRLRPLYLVEPPRRTDPLTELVYTVLSQHTSDANSVPAGDELIGRFGSWERIAKANVDDVADAIRRGGLAQLKAKRIQAILREIKSKRGKYDLSFLKDMPLEDAREWLSSLNGVGPKTAACVLLFSLNMPALPVDTHVYRVAQRLRLIGRKVTPAQAHATLEAMLKPADVLAFHVLLITHGRQVCKAQRPLCLRTDTCGSLSLRVVSCCNG